MTGERRAANEERARRRPGGRLAGIFGRVGVASHLFSECGRNEQGSLRNAAIFRGGTRRRRRVPFFSCRLTDHRRYRVDVIQRVAACMRRTGDEGIHCRPLTCSRRIRSGRGSGLWMCFAAYFCGQRDLRLANRAEATHRAFGRGQAAARRRASVPYWTACKSQDLLHSVQVGAAGTKPAARWPVAGRPGSCTAPYGIRGGADGRLVTSANVER